MLSEEIELSEDIESRPSLLSCSATEAASLANDDELLLLKMAYGEMSTSYVDFEWQGFDMISSTDDPNSVLEFAVSVSNPQIGRFIPHVSKKRSNLGYAARQRPLTTISEAHVLDPTDDTQLLSVEDGLLLEAIAGGIPAEDENEESALLRAMAYGELASVGCGQLDSAMANEVSAQEGAAPPHDPPDYGREVASPCGRASNGQLSVSGQDDDNAPRPAPHPLSTFFSGRSRGPRPLQAILPSRLMSVGAFHRFHGSVSSSL